MANAVPVAQWRVASRSRLRDDHEYTPTEGGGVVISVYVRTDSPFYWLLLERPGQKPLREPTKIPKTAYSATLKKQNAQTAQDLYTLRMGELARQDADLPTIGPKRTIAFAKYASWFAAHHLKTRRGVDRERYALTALTAFFGDSDLSTIDRPRVAEYHTERLKAGKTESTVNREVDLLKSMLREAVPKYLKVSPLVGMKKLRTVKRAKRIVEADEEASLLAAFRDPRDRALYIVAVDTLIRLSNVINLRWAEVKEGYLDLVDSKTGPYRVALSDRATQALKALKTKRGVHCFPHRRRAKLMRDNRGTIRRILQRACTRANIPYGRGIGVTFHTATRATGATRMLRAGVDPRTVQAVGNWKDFRVMQEYLEPDTPAMKAAVNAIAGASAHGTITPPKTSKKGALNMGRS